MATVKIDANQWDDDPAAAIAEVNRVSNMTRIAAPFSPAGELHFYLINLHKAKEQFLEDTKSLPDKERRQAVLKMLQNWHIDNPPPKGVSRMTEALQKFDIDNFIDSPTQMQEIIDYLGKPMDEAVMKKGRDLLKADIMLANKNKKTNNEQ